MKWFVIIVVSAAGIAEAEEAALTQDTGAAKVEYALAATGITAASTAVAIGVGVLLHSVPYSIDGRPNPWVTTGGFAVAVGLNAALTHLAVPLVAQALRQTGTVADLRDHAWKTSRWALLGGGVGVATFALGSALEQSSFGRGQGVMAAGAVLSVLALLVWDVLEIVQTWATP